MSHRRSTSEMIRTSRPGVAWLAIVLLLGIPGCRGPSQANIELRKRIQELEAKIGELERARLADRATIQSLQAQRGALPTLPHDRLEQLFTTHGIKLGRLTGGADLDRETPGDEGFRVYVTPVDGSGDTLKAAGSFTVQAFDLSLPENQLVGEWSFDLEQSRKSWHSGGLLYTYVLTCPWESPPTNAELTVRVTFQDELTGRIFTEQRVVRVTLPQATTQPPLG